MRRYLIGGGLFALAAIVGLVGWFTLGDKDNIEPSIELAQSPKGTDFYHLPIYDDGESRVAILVAWPHLAPYDNTLNPATSYVAADAILSGGTADLEPQDVLELFNDLEARGQITTGPSHIRGQLQFPREHLDGVVPIAAEMLANPQFEQAWIDRVEADLFANQSQFMEQSANKMWEASRLAVLGEQPLFNHLSLPDLSVIQNVSRDELVTWHQDTIVQSGAIIAVSGAISVEDAGNAVDQLLSGLPIGTGGETPQVRLDFAPRTVLLHLPEAEKTTLGIIGQLPATTEGGDLEDLLALSFFGRSGEGPLFEAIRTNLRATYSIQAGYTNYDRPTRLMFIAGEVETEKLAEAHALVLETYEAFRTDPDLEGFVELRDSIADGAKNNIRRPMAAAYTAVELAIDGQDTMWAVTLDELLAGIGEDDIRARLKEVYPTANELISFVVSPDANALPGACVITEIEQVLDC